MKILTSVEKTIALLILILALCVFGCEEDIPTDAESPYNQQYLTHEHSLVWSPDSSMLVYISNNSIVLRVVETKKMFQLTGIGFYDEPSWSPDSTRIAYSSATYTQRADIWVKKADGSDVASRITSDSAADYHPRWSPDGSLIAFHSRRTKSTDIWLRNSNGSGEDVAIYNDEYTDQNAEWSPDGTKLAFESKKTGNFDIWVVGIDGKNPTIQVTSDTASDKKPLWSPDGTKIAFVSDRDGTSGIWVKNSDGSGDAVCVSLGYPNATMHDWSPNGKWIAFVSDKKIYVNSSDGTGEVKEIITGYEPRWSPDGTRMACLALLDGQYKIHIMELPDDLM